MTEIKPAGAPDEPCVIWSGEHFAYWRPDASGYSAEIRGAGIYPRADAARRTGHCGPEKRIEIRPLSQEIAKARTTDGTIEAAQLAAAKVEGLKLARKLIREGFFKNGVETVADDIIAHNRVLIAKIDAEIAAVEGRAAP